MKASEARLLSSKERSNKSGKDLETVYKRINAAVLKGEFDIFYYGRLSSETKEQLKEDGYTVEDITDPRDNLPTYKIQW